MGDLLPRLGRFVCSFMSRMSPKRCKSPHPILIIDGRSASEGVIVRQTKRRQDFVSRTEATMLQQRLAGVMAVLGLRALRHETWIATSQPCGSVSLPFHGAVQQPQSVVRLGPDPTSGRLVAVEVFDDGVGRADAARGSGLRGLADRVEALGGRLRIDSLAGGGTHLLPEIPLRGRVAPSGWLEPVEADDGTGISTNVTQWGLDRASEDRRHSTPGSMVGVSHATGSAAP